MIERPIRVQLRRTRGRKMPPNTMKVDRTTMLGNRWRIGFSVETAEEAVDLYRQIESTDPRHIARARETLRGKNLACWCKVIDADGNYVPCHADVLLRLANDQAKPQHPANQKGNEIQ